MDLSEEEKEEDLNDYKRDY